jgi:SpoVK/Ycf46/Vps4 family AAA+-type ATPase
MSFGKSRAKRMSPDSPKTTYKDVAGADEAVEELQEIKEFLENPKKFQALGARIPKGVLLYGPPGTGKTLLAKALANECGVNFISVDGPEIFTKWLGESEEGVRQVFRIARQVAPTVIFFDQLEAIAPIRGQHSGSMTTDRVVSQLLAELDGVEQLSGVIVLGATNRIDLIDPSVIVTLGLVALEALKRIHYHDFVLKDAIGKVHRWNGRLLVPLYHPSPQVLASHRREAEQLNDYKVIAQAMREATKLPR